MTYKRVYDELGGYSLEDRAERCEDVDLWSRFMQKGFVGHNMPDLLYSVTEDDSAVKRRSLSSRIKLAKTRRVICKRLGLRGFSAFKRIYGHILLAFIPTPIYKKLHMKKMAKDSVKVKSNNK
jgi:glycosyltransferase EpsE